MTDWTDLPDLQAVAKAQADGMEIEYSCATEWHQWNGNLWNTHNQYRACPRQPEMKKVLMECWYIPDTAELSWVSDCAAVPHTWIRIPAQDIEIEIPEGV